MRRVVLAPKSICEYEGLIGEEAVGEIRELAASLRGARVLHVNATAYGDGVAELLPSLVGLKCGLGLEVEWHVLTGNASFTELTQKLHNGLQGMEVALDPSDRALYLSTLESNLEVVSRAWDFVVVHDPQPVGFLGLLDGRRTGHWLWRCHVDTSTPGEAAVDFLAPYTRHFEVSLVSMPGYAVPELHPSRTEVVLPSIDPLTPKNQALSPSLARQILATRFGLDPERPLIAQVSRFGPWKDPLGVIDAYREVKRRVADVQLALVGNLADNDPEGTEYLAMTLDHAAGDTDIHVFSTLDRLSRDELTHALEINAFQSGSDVVLQKSIREGFGLAATEAMWKRAAVVAGRVGGLVEQIEDGVHGYLVSSVEECAECVAVLLQKPELRQKMGARARERVRERFIAPRHLADYLRILQSF
ncbi:MAG: glycosyltransferase [Gemmatimonadota bacterium]|nr:MAG: glycosyltransferase [Gemmatimonadota bacterium]